jgi:hypothetical protein
MKSVNELLDLFMRQARLERAMKQPGGARVIDEQELHAVRRKLAAFPDAIRAVAQAAHGAANGNAGAVATPNKT